MIDDVELDDSILEAIERDVASYREMRINAAKKRIAKQRQRDNDNTPSARGRRLAVRLREDQSLIIEIAEKYLGGKSIKELKVEYGGTVRQKLNYLADEQVDYLDPFNKEDYIERRDWFRLSLRERLSRAKAANWIPPQPRG